MRLSFGCLLPVLAVALFGGCAATRDYAVSEIPVKVIYERDEPEPGIPFYLRGEYKGDVPVTIPLEAGSYEFSWQSISAGVVRRRTVEVDCNDDFFLFANVTGPQIEYGRILIAALNQDGGEALSCTINSYPIE